MIDNKTNRHFEHYSILLYIDTLSICKILKGKQKELGRIIDYTLARMKSLYFHTFDIRNCN